MIIDNTGTTPPDIDNAPPTRHDDGHEEHGGSFRRILRWMRRNKIATVCLLVLAALVAELLTIPWFDIPRLKSGNPGLTSLMRQRLDEARSAGKQLRISQSWVPLSQIPRHLIDAVIVAEDGTFFSHGGVDWFEVKESFNKDVRERRVVRGGSTITQQLAKNLYLSTSKDPVRKLKELVITLLLERELDKDRILELYLNVIEWGRGTFGVEAASHAYFGKPASALTLDEATRLAAIIPSPLRHPADAESIYVTRRKQIVLDRMAARNMVDRANPVVIAVEPPLSGDTTALPDTTEAEEEENDGL